MKKITTIILALSLALTVVSCQKELVTPEPPPSVTQTDTTIVYKVYADNPDVKFDIINYASYEGLIMGETAERTLTNSWSKTITYRRGTQLDYGLYLDFSIHEYVTIPGCPPPPPNYNGNVTGEIWFNGVLVTSQTISGLGNQGSLYYPFN
jgi:hypothetical protein